MDSQNKNVTEKDQDLNMEAREDGLSTKAKDNQDGPVGSSSGNGQQAAAAKGGAEDAKDTAGNLLELAKTTAGDAYEAVSEKASSVINERKSDFTYGLVGVADTVRRVGTAITEGESKNGVTEYASTYTDTAARKLESAAEYFEGTDLKGLARDVESYARRNPAIFLGAAFALGVLAARFIKSSPPAEPLSTGAAMNKKAVGASNGSSVGASA